MFIDPSGTVIDVIADVGFIIWDAYEIFDEPTDWINYAALVLDVVCAFIPFVTGGGKAAKFIAKLFGRADKVVDAIKTVDKIESIADTLKATEKVVTVTRTAEKVDDAVKIADATKKIDKLADTTGALKKGDNLTNVSKPIIEETKTINNVPGTTGKAPSGGGPSIGTKTNNGLPAGEIKYHGNSLDHPGINYGYVLKDSSGNILKYGESLNPAKRYSKNYLKMNSITMEQLTSGSKREIHEWQRNMNRAYKAQHLKFPPLVKSRGGW